MERTVLLAKESLINEIVFASSLDGVHKMHIVQNEKLGSLEEIERAHILRVLEACGGKISGPGGASEILQISTSSLYAKMKKYGIKADFY